MGTKPVVPSLVVRDPRYAIVTLDGSTALGQVRSVQMGSTANRDKKTAIAVGDEVAVTFYGPPDYTHKVDLEVFAHGDLDDFVALMGGTTLAAGDSISLDSTNVVASLMVQVFNGPTTAATKELTYTITNFTPLSMETNIDASGGDALIMTISGECTGIAFTAP